MRKKLTIVIAGSLLGALLAPPIGRALADRIGTSVGASAALAAQQLARVVPPPPPAAPAAPLWVEAAPEQPMQQLAVGSRSARRGAKHPAVKVRRGVFISSATVLRLAQARAIPTAVPVPAQGKRPAGLRLLGVSGLGVGMRDGDVLTRVFGVPAASVPAVVQGVMVARARHAREISAEFWRNGEPWSLTVEQPYLQPSSPP